MSKAVMLSIQPKWCELIASGRKTIEVRKTMPKLETPFKCYIYCTNTRPFLVWGDVFRGNWETEFTHLVGYSRKEAEKIWDVFNGRVLGEFVCDTIEPIACHKYNNGVGYDYSYYTESKDTLTNEAQLTDYDMQWYLGSGGDGEWVGYAWHISDLKIYDTPKELGEFENECKQYGAENPMCDDCKYYINCTGYEFDESDCACDGYKPLKRPFQSWGYVEV